MRLFTCIVTLLLYTFAHADGLIAKKGGGLVPEREQHAFIEWASGQQRLYVRTVAEGVALPTVWIIPVSSDPKQVKAKPVERMPSVHEAVFPLPMARDKLQLAGEFTLKCDTGYQLSPLWWLFTSRPFLATTSHTFAVADSALATGRHEPADGTVVVHSHVEALGMIVEVITAQTPESLQQYFKDKKLDLDAKQFTSLADYFKGGYSFICNWRDVSPLVARAVQIDFPSAGPFYPLLPTRANPTAVQTSVYVTGWYQPTATMNLPGLVCQRMLAKVVHPDDDAALGREPGARGLTAKQLEAVRLRPITQLWLGNNPKDWTQDLVLESSSIPREEVAGWIARQDFLTLLVCYALVGLVVSPLALVLVRDRPRTWRDARMAAITGLAMAGTPLLSGFVYVLWRQADAPKEERSWLKQEPLSSLGLLVFLAAIPVWLVWMFSYALRRFCLDWLLMVLAHLAVMTLECHYLQEWLLVG